MIACWLLVVAALGQSLIDSPSSLTIGPPPMYMDDIEPHCWNFTYGNWRIQEFYTPNYPGEYLNNTDCVLYLEAPSGFRIHLDFRDKFVLEKSEDCKYDYLEVRDGPFAYSPFIKRYCGADFPHIIVSSGRFLWLRFKTDDVLQYGGFRAVYSYHKDHTQNDGTEADRVTSGVCRIPIKLTNDEADGVLASSDLQAEVDTDDPSIAKGQTVDCTWEIYSDKGYRIHLKSSELEMKHRRRCDLNNITVYERTTLDTAVKEGFCRSQNELMDILSESNRVFVRLYGSSLNNKPMLKLTYTRIRKAPGDCSEIEFACGDVCIPTSLLCNGIDNCRDRSDEKGCPRFRSSKGRGSIGGARDRNSLDGGLKPRGGEAASAGGSAGGGGGVSDSANTTHGVPLYIIISGVVGGVVLTCVSISVCVMCMLRRRRREKRQEETTSATAAHHQKPTQRNALEMAVSNSCNTTQSLSRQQQESQGHRPGMVPDRQYYVTSKVNPVAPTPVKDSSHRYSLTDHSLTTVLGDDHPLTDPMTESGNYKRFLTMDLGPDDPMSESLHQHLPGKYSVTPGGGVMGLTSLDHRLTDGYQGYHGGQWHPSVKDDVMVYPYSSPSGLSAGSSPFLGISKSFSYSQPECKFESKYLKSLKTKDNEAIREYQGS